jgi:predicted pyridoxine 5'-phosphate oxidase superfamily flavin-nucleotide-binding protein
MSDTRPLAFDDEIRDAIASAFATGNFVTVAYVDADGWAHVSRRGTTQVLDDTTLALWARKRNDGLAVSILERPQVTLFYLDLADRGVVYTFYGHARIADDPGTAERVWNGSPERERQQDPDRSGVPILIDVDRVVAQGRQPDRNFVLQR